MGGGWVVVGGGMRANTETSRSSARARAATTMSINNGSYLSMFIFQQHQKTMIHSTYLQTSIMYRTPSMFYTSFRMMQRWSPGLRALEWNLFI